jgi:uncharacterized protein YcbK (DUF882 family)
LNVLVRTSLVEVFVHTSLVEVFVHTSLVELFVHTALVEGVVHTSLVEVFGHGLLDVLHQLSAKLEAGQPFQVISGYRSPKTNARLARSGSGVAHHSLHMQGKAIDIRAPGIELSNLRDAAKSLGRGGVGYYPASDFVHVDIGPVRHWALDSHADHDEG